MLAMGWRGSAIHWHRYEMAYLLLAGLATPLVISVHTVVSFDFAAALVPGWHSTIFPPYFVAGAIYSGFAMVLTIAIPLRRLYGLEDLITDRHLKNMGVVMLATGMVVAYGYLMETFTAWYSGDIFEQYLMMNRMFGPYGYMYWLLILFNILIPQLLWVRRVQTNVPAAIFDRHLRQHRHVARALRHRRCEPASRLHAVGLGHVFRHGLRLRGVRGLHRVCLFALLFLLSVSCR